MKHFARFDSMGQYICTGIGPEDVVDTEDPLTTYFGEVAADSQYHDLSTNQPVNMPSKPSKYHRFDYTTKQWIDPRTNETQWVVVRAERNKLLVASDWTQMPDAPESNKTAWATYRQALRDITAQADPFNIVWPVAPG